MFFVIRFKHDTRDDTKDAQAITYSGFIGHTHASKDELADPMFYKKIANALMFATKADAENHIRDYLLPVIKRRPHSKLLVTRVHFDPFF
jgi:hypothetical protein